MSEAAASPRPPDRGATRPGLLAIFAILAAFLIWEMGFGEGIAVGIDHLWRGAGPSAPLIVIVLTGFMISAGSHVRSACNAELAALAPRLDGSPAQRSALLEASASRNSGAARIAAAAGLLVGLLVIPSQQTGLPALFAPADWSHRVVWAFATNGLLFWIMGSLAYETLEMNRLYRRVARLLPPVDLLDPSDFAPFAHRGLRVAFLWIGGSTIASLIYVDLQGISAGLVICATVALGVGSLVYPLVDVHRSIRAAKEIELRSVRGAIDAARRDLLDRTQATNDAAARVAGLLAYEARIDSVREWPVDPSTLTRFAILMTVAVGSWVGGALVERLLGLAID